MRRIASARHGLGGYERFAHRVTKHTGSALLTVLYRSPSSLACPPLAAILGHEAPLAFKPLGFPARYRVATHSCFPAKRYWRYNTVEEMRPSVAVRRNVRWSSASLNGGLVDGLVKRDWEWK